MPFTLCSAASPRELMEGGHPNIAPGMQGWGTFISITLPSEFQPPRVLPAHLNALEHFMFSLSHCTDEDTKAQRLRILSKVTQLISSKADNKCPELGNYTVAQVVCTQ